MSAVTQDNQNVNFAVISEPLDSLIAAIASKVEREWPAGFAAVRSARELFLLTVRASAVTYRTVRYITAEIPPDPHRSLEYSISIPPLNRTILDSLFNLIFIMEDLQGRCEWYFKADWRETRLELNRYKLEYGHLPDWQDWLKRLEDYSDSGIALFGISSAEAAAPSTIKSWPNPGAIPRYQISPTTALPPNRAFLSYMNDWFYADLSQQAHLTGGGLVKRAGALLTDYRRNSETERQLRHFAKAQLGQTVALMLALVSEIDAHMNFGLRERAKYVWALACPFIAVAKEVYEKRYQVLLA